MSISAPDYTSSLTEPQVLADLLLLTSALMSDIMRTLHERFMHSLEGLMAVAQAAEIVLTQAHREGMRVSTAEGATALRAVLTPRLVAYITGVDATRTVARWARGETANLRSDHATRLRTAYEIVRLLEQARESPATIQAWFLGMNPVLDDCSPARAVREGDYAGARTAAVTFLAEG